MDTLQPCICEFAVLLHHFSFFKAEKSSKRFLKFGILLYKPATLNFHPTVFLTYLLCFLRFFMLITNSLEQIILYNDNSTLVDSVYWVATEVNGLQCIEIR